MTDNEKRLNRLIGSYSGRVRRISRELDILSTEMLLRDDDIIEEDITTILTALVSLVESSTTVSEIIENEIFDDLKEWLNENG